MITPRLFLCSGYQLQTDDPRRNEREIAELDGLGSSANVNIKLEDVAKVFLKHLSPRLVDLLEIASYSNPKLFVDSLKMMTYTW